MSGLSSLTGGGGLSASGGAAGPAQSGVNSTSSVTLGGNSGIGSSTGFTGFSPVTIAVIGVVAVTGLFFVLRARK